MLTNHAWQPIPGAEGVEVYPFLRKPPDILSSNSYLIRTAGQVILIDPGALEEQSAALGRVIAGCLADHLRPLFIFVTHCHIDHSLEAPAFRLPAAGGEAWIAACAEGYEYLAAGDERFTIAELYGIPFPAFRPDIQLLTPEDRATMAPRSLTLPGGIVLRLDTENLSPAGQAPPFFRQVISLGEETLELFHTPGHSPDSACFRIGGILFIGDLLAACNPMVAGIAGWRREDYVATLDNLTGMLAGAPPLLCCPGHGGILTAAQALDAFRKLRTEASSLVDPAEMNAERLHFTTEYALDLIGEAEEVFSAVAGRLYYVSYWLEELGEEAAAGTCRALIDTDQIDGCLADFRKLAAELRKGRRIKAEFAFRSLAIIQKIKKLFNRAALDGILPRQLLERATRLVMDFIRMTKGVRDGEGAIPVDLNELVGTLLDELRKNPHTDDSIIGLAEDREAFLAALAVRIASEPLFAETELRFESLDALPLVRLDPARFRDNLADLLGQLAVGGAKSLFIAAGTDADGALLRVVPAGDPAPEPLSEARERLFARRFAMCRVDLRREDHSFVMRIPS